MLPPVQLMTKSCLVHLSSRLLAADVGPLIEDDAVPEFVRKALKVLRADRRSRYAA